MSQPSLNQAEIYQKLMRYCAYQERCSADIYKKIQLWNLTDELAKDAVEYLKTEGFVDELRFAKSFVRGKFRSNKWGRVKIKEGLFAKKVSGDIINEALKELQEEDYEGQLKSILHKKNILLKEEDEYKRTQKLALYAQSKGYELNLIWKHIKKLNE